jgi:hypothetical protein
MVKRISSSIDELGAIRGVGLAAQRMSGARALTQVCKVEKNAQNYASFVALACSFTLIKSIHRTSVSLAQWHIPALRQWRQLSSVLPTRSAN